MPDLKPLECPKGPIEIRQIFGDIDKYISSSKSGQPILDSEFESKYIRTIKLPYPLRLAWNREKKVSYIRCHTLLAERFLAIFNEIGKEVSDTQSLYLGGCFNFRLKRNGLGLSTHSWGIAIDLNPETNRKNTIGNMPPEIVTSFENYGFIWGGSWNGRARDPMHFQYCRGY
jgi:hypothetical protein